MNALSDEEQLDNLKSFAKKYGSAMMSGILIALIAILHVYILVLEMFLCLYEMF